jgi:flagellar protein FlaG
MSTIASLGTPLKGAATPQGGRTPPVARGTPAETSRGTAVQLPAVSELQSIERLVKMAPAPEELKTIVNELQRTMNARASDLQFSIDEGSGKTIVRMTDRSTKDIVWQFPSEEALQISRDLENFQQGLMINRSA